MKEKIIDPNPNPILTLMLIFILFDKYDVDVDYKMFRTMMKLSLMMMIIDVNSAPPLVVDEDVTAFSFVRIGKRSHRDLSTYWL